MFLQKQHVSYSNAYGLSAASDGTTPVLDCYDSIAAAAAAGQAGLLVIDITNPRVYVEHSTMHRAKFLARRYKGWVFFVSVGFFPGRVYQTRKFSQHER